ncbi:MAG: hypothetical protein U0350_19390 [Caldilineaceae bacterium]
MRTVIRTILIIGGLLMLALAAGYFMQQTWAKNLWPWPDSRLSYIFIAAMQAAIATAMLWIGLSGELNGIAPGALNLVVMMGGLASYLGMSGQAMPQINQYAIGCGLFAFFNLLLFLWSRKLGNRSNAQPTPGFVRASYGLFILVLLAVGSALILKIPNTFPWPLKPESSVVFGWMFVGDAFYFLYALLYPGWPNARTQLWSFLAYDLVLIGPFIAHFSDVKPELRNSLIVYTAVLLYSGLLAIYYLFLHRTTRLGANR